MRKRDRAAPSCRSKLADERGFTVGSAQRLTGTPPRRGGKVPAIGEAVAAANADDQRAAASVKTAGCKKTAARRHPRRRFLDGLGRPDLHAQPRRSRRRRDQDRGDPVSGLVARRRSPPGLRAGPRIREGAAVLHHEPQQARHHARSDAKGRTRARQAADRGTPTSWSTITRSRCCRSSASATTCCTS